MAILFLKNESICSGYFVLKNPDSICSGYFVFQILNQSALAALFFEL
jgi:hypothetical protein